MACEKGGKPEVLASPAVTPQTSRYRPLCEVRLRMLACVYVPFSDPQDPVQAVPPYPTVAQPLEKGPAWHPDVCLVSLQPVTTKAAALVGSLFSKAVAIPNQLRAHLFALASHLSASRRLFLSPSLCPVVHCCRYPSYNDAFAVPAHPTAESSIRCPTLTSLHAVV